MTTQLTKPHFVKVIDLQNARSGYNVYVKVISVEKSQTQSKIPIVRAVVADETGAANAFFKGETASLIETGNVIAIRNGTIKLIKQHISLEVDIFGRITPQTVQVKAETSKNISEKEIERRPRRYDNNREGGQRRPRRQGDGDRRPRREFDGQRRPRREFDGQRKPRRDFDGQRRPRREENGQRQPRRQDNGQRGQRREDYVQRGPRREDNRERQPRRQDNGQRGPRGDFDRRPRRQNNEGDRRPRRQNNTEGDRRPRREQQRGDRRPPLQFTKISALEPGDEGINFFAQVVSVEPVGKKARVVLGDQTGTVRAFVFLNEHIKQGESIVLFRAEARVVKQHIEVQVPREGRIDQARRKVEQVNDKFDVSAKEWIEADQ